MCGSQVCRLCGSHFAPIDRMKLTWSGRRRALLHKVGTRQIHSANPFGVLGSTSLAATHIALYKRNLGPTDSAPRTVECKASERRQVGELCDAVAIG